MDDDILEQKFEALDALNGNVLIEQQHLVLFGMERDPIDRDADGKLEWIDEAALNRPDLASAFGKLQSRALRGAGADRPIV